MPRASLWFFLQLSAFSHANAAPESAWLPEPFSLSSTFQMGAFAPKLASCNDPSLVDLPLVSSVAMSRCCSFAHLLMSNSRVATFPGSVCPAK